MSTDRSAAEAAARTGAVPPAAENALWQTPGAWHTLHPVPAHPLSHEAHFAAVRLPKPGALAVAFGTSARCGPWKMLPAQAGAEQVGPPKPGGHAHALALSGTP